MIYLPTPMSDSGCAERNSDVPLPSDRHANSIVEFLKSKLGEELWGVKNGTIDIVCKE